MAHFRRNSTARAWSSAFVVALLMLLSADAANGAAAGPAPQYDPDSAAGKEYALPLAQARQQAQAEQAGSGGDKRAATAGTTELFGDGITPVTAQAQAPRRSAATPSHGNRQQAGPAGAPAKRDRAGAPHDATTAPTTPASRPATTPSAGASGALVGLVSGGVVLLLAALLTFLARRRANPAAATEARG